MPGRKDMTRCGRLVAAATLMVALPTAGQAGDTELAEVATTFAQIAIAMEHCQIGFVSDSAFKYIVTTTKQATFSPDDLTKIFTTQTVMTVSLKALLKDKASIETFCREAVEELGSNGSGKGLLNGSGRPKS